VADLRKRAKRLVDALRTSRGRQEDLEARVQASLHTQTDADAKLNQLIATTRETNERIAELEQNVEELEQERTQLTQQYTASQDEVAQLREQTAEALKRSASAEQTAASAAERNLSQLEMARTELRREKDELVQLRQSLSVERDRLLAERAAWPDEQEPVGRRQPGEEDTDRRRDHSSHKEAESAIARLRELSLWSENTPSGADDDQAPSADESFRGSSAPVSFIENYAGNLVDDAEPGFPAARATDAPDHAPRRRDYHAESDEAAATAEPHGGAAAPSDDDESLEEYMARLMQRVRGDEPPRTTSAAKLAPRPLAPPQNPTKAAKPSVKPEQALPKGDFRLEDMKRTSALPERAGNFAAMRELANQSAHRAISTYQTERNMRDVVGKLVSSVVCLASALGILYCAPKLVSSATLGALAAVVASGYFGIKGVLVLLSANWQSRTSRRQQPVQGQQSAAPSPTKTQPSEVEPTPASEVEGKAAGVSLEEEVHRLHQL
jgi:hypothetical protein